VDDRAKPHVSAHAGNQRRAQIHISLEDYELGEIGVRCILGISGGFILGEQTFRTDT
ncbi:hypothetical protein ACLOJK_007371, partial [Asimina triloba]